MCLRRRGERRHTRGSPQATGSEGVSTSSRGASSSRLSLDAPLRRSRSSRSGGSGGGGDLSPALGVVRGVLVR